MNFEKLALDILLINEIENKFDVTAISNDIAKEKSNDFYKTIFKDKIENIDDKISYTFDKKLTSYCGFCKPTGFIPSGVSKVTIILPEEKSIKKAITISHEKAHAYHMLLGVETSEIVPTFLEILNSIMLDKDFPGIKIDNLNYKIKEVKKVAKVYLKHHKKYNYKMQEDYMKDFVLAIFLVKQYLSEDKDKVTEKILKNLHGLESLPVYKDDINISEIIEYIKK